MPVVVIADGSPCGIVYVLATVVVVVSGGRHGATHDSPEGSESEWSGECHDNRSCGFVGMPLVHPNGSARPWVLWCGYSVLPLRVCV